MAKEQLITKFEDELVEIAYRDAVELISAVRRNYFSLAQLLASTQQSSQKAFLEVRDRLARNEILDAKSTNYLAMVGSAKQGFLLQHQEQLPHTVSSLYELKKIIDDDNGFNKLKKELKEGKNYSTFTHLEIKEAFKEFVSQRLSKTDTKPITTKTEQKNTGDLAVTIKIPKQQININHKKILNDVKKVKEIMKYAEVETHGQLKQLEIDEE